MLYQKRKREMEDRAEQLRQHQILKNGLQALLANKLGGDKAMQKVDSYLRQKRKFAI